MGSIVYTRIHMQLPQALLPRLLLLLLAFPSSAENQAGEGSDDQPTADDGGEGEGRRVGKERIGESDEQKGEEIADRLRKSGESAGDELIVKQEDEDVQRRLDPKETAGS